MAIQTGYGPQEPVDSQATRLMVSFVVDVGVGTIEPIQTNSANYPDHTILLALQNRVTAEGPVLVRHRPEGLAHRTLLALRPEDARKLAQQLLHEADSLDQK